MPPAKPYIFNHRICGNTDIFKKLQFPGTELTSILFSLCILGMGNYFSEITCCNSISQPSY